MSEYISREAAIAAAFSANAIGNSAFRDVCDTVNRIRMIPAADVVKRKHGEWYDATTLDNEFICWVCSECRHGADFVDEPYNFCPNCGADMRGDDNGT